MSLFLLSERLNLRRRLRLGWWLGALLSASLVLGACDLIENDDADEQQSQQQASQQEEPVQADASDSAAASDDEEEDATAAEPVREPPPTARGGGEGADAYSIIFPSLALVTSGESAATGLVISDGYVLVDERLLESAAADVLFSNGEMLAAAPIVGRDQLTGLAYLGPLDSSLVRGLPAARLRDGERLREGSAVYAVGWDAGDESGSRPRVTSGVLGGFVEWEAGERTFLRADARPDGVPSVRVLVDNGGAVIGIGPAALVERGLYVSAGDLARSLSLPPPAPTQPIATDVVPELVPGAPLVGAVDEPGDVDTYSLSVRADAVYEISAESILLDTTLLVEGGGVDDIDDDSRGGLLGWDAALTVSPQEDGDISVAVQDFSAQGTGAYVLSVTQVGGEPEPASPVVDASAMVSGSILPTPRGEHSLRAEITDEGLVPTLLGIDSEIDETGALLVPDGDGVFEIVVSVVGTNNNTARLFVFDDDGAIVLSGRVIVNCETEEPCLASGGYLTPDEASGPAGTWRVLLQPEGAGSTISAWQIDVFGYE